MEEFFFSRCSFFGWVLYLITSVLSTVVFRRALSFQLLESKQICKIKNQSSQYRNYPKTWFQEKHKLIHSSHPIIAYHCHSLILLLKIAPTKSHQPCEVSGGRLLWFILLINVHQSITHVCCLYCILGVDADREGKVSACLVCLSYCIVRMCFAFLILLLYFWIPDLLLIPCA